MKDLGEAAYILGIKIYRDRSKRLIGLCQNVYIEKILKRYSMENSKRRSIPMQEKLKLSKSQGASTPAEMKRMQNVPYASAVGSIMNAVRCTRPDVAFAQNITSRFQQNPRAIAIANESGITKGARHFRAKVHYLREELNNTTIHVQSSLKKTYHGCRTEDERLLRNTTKSVVNQQEEKKDSGLKRRKKNKKKEGKRKKGIFKIRRKRIEEEENMAAFFVTKKDEHSLCS
nr:retrotransposon protein, putative, Ty1-copia subclass [Tanacetum cinerariifolium]